jgi:hypothetical protein
MWARTLKRVLREDSTKPYYRWIVGGQEK